MSQIQFKNNWEETIQRFDAWFQHKNTGRPLMLILAEREPGTAPCEELTEEPFDNAEDKYLNAEKNYARIVNMYQRLEPMAEAFPHFAMDLGAGSLALYLGCEPVFAPDTIWFKTCLEDYSKALPLKYDPNNYWWRKHLEILKRQVELTKDTDIMVCIPDLVENVDILSAMRDPQTFCFDLYDYPDEVHEALQNLSDVYMQYYDPIYEIVKTSRGLSTFTCYDILATGKVSKFQCDCSAMLSPAQYDEYVLPSLKRQCDEIPNSLYHLDGPECICHLDSLMTIEKLDAVQWVPGAANPDSGDECWFDKVYAKVRNAGKGQIVLLQGYKPQDAIDAADRIVKRFGPDGMFFQFPAMSHDMAEKLLIKADRDWKY